MVEGEEGEACCLTLGVLVAQEEKLTLCPKFSARRASKELNRDIVMMMKMSTYALICGNSNRKTYVDNDQIKEGESLLNE